MLSKAKRPFLNIGEVLFIKVFVNIFTPYKINIITKIVMQEMCHNLFIHYKSMILLINNNILSFLKWILVYFLIIYIYLYIF